MNQIIIIGEAKKISILKNKDLTLTLSTKDHDQKVLDVKIKVEKGYPTNMLDVLNTKPLVAVKCDLGKTKNGVEFIASKMSVLKLTGDDNNE
jgi:hypothetical protein